MKHTVLLCLSLMLNACATEAPLPAAQTSAPTGWPAIRPPVPRNLANFQIDTRPQRVVASQYSLSDHGRPTASGELYDLYALTAAHPSLPFGSYVQVTNPVNQAHLRLRINDRSPTGSALKISWQAAQRLGLPPNSLVTLQPLAPGR